MCQLVLVNTRSKLANQLILAATLQIDSLQNRDGTGFLCVSKDKVEIWKTAEAADNISNLGLIIGSEISTTYPVIGHVRAASKGIVVTEKNAHPFGLKRFYLAHNGRLYKKDAEVSWSSSNDDTALESDSLVFLQAIEKNGNKHPEMSIVELLTLTMSEFKGKFALMLYDSLYDKFYVIRGSLADLHMAKLTKFTKEKPEEGIPFGFIVNTKKMSLADSITISLQAAQIVTGFMIESGPIEELKKETIYEVRGLDLVEIGEIKENPVTYTSQTQSNNSNLGWSRGGTDKFSANTQIPIWGYAETINKFMEKNFLLTQDIDALFYLFFGVGMADASLLDVKRFATQVIQLISARKTTRKRMSAVMDKYAKIWPIYYTTIPGLQYPWMLSDDATITKLINLIREQNKKAAG